MKKLFAQLLSKNISIFIAIVLFSSIPIVFASTTLPRKIELLETKESFGLNTFQDTKAEFKAQFFQLCDSAIVKIKDKNNKDPFFVDSYGIRALCVAYDMTKNQKYLAAARSWSKRMVEFQKKMIPKGAYFMNYKRKPGESIGDWYAADCSSIAMGVLATAVRCNGADREHFIHSVEQFAKLVLKNYVRPCGGISDGLWPQYDGPWWCSSSLFGSMLFNLYANTGNKTYLNEAFKIVDYLKKLDLSKVEPLPLSHQGPSLPMYVLEAYSAGLPFLSSNTHCEKLALAKISWCLNWIKNEQQIPLSKRKWQLTDWWGAKYCGLPFHQFIYSRFFHTRNDLSNSANHELFQLSQIVFSQKLNLKQAEMFMLMSLAERLDPGGIYRNIKSKH